MHIFFGLDSSSIFMLLVGFYLYIYSLGPYQLNETPRKTTRIYKDRIVFWYLVSVAELWLQTGNR